MENYPRGLFFKPIICDLRRFKAISGYIYPLIKTMPLKAIFSCPSTSTTLYYYYKRNGV